MNDPFLVRLEYSEFFSCNLGFLEGFVIGVHFVRCVVVRARVIENVILLCRGRDELIDLDKLDIRKKYRQKNTHISLNLCHLRMPIHRQGDLEATSVPATTAVSKMNSSFLFETRVVFKGDLGKAFASDVSFYYWATILLTLTILT